MKTDEIRQAYIDFFVERGHKHVPSSPLVPHGDPTLLFTSAGMVQFKPYYSGEIDPLPFTRAVTCQKCFRAGGKGSDLENVGKTLRHHTFFEMLGNFSFGDYFKREACTWAVEFSRDVAKLDMDRVWVTHHKDDEEARRIWIDELGYEEQRVIPLGDKDNWWGPAGDTGACGPCSEMHYDRGPEYGTGPEDKIGGDTDRYIEYWNMVFPQFDQQPDGSRPTLKNRGIDTGLGLARLALLKQGADSAYTIDSMWPITKASAEAAGVSDYLTSPKSVRLAVNAIADHIRALTFVISEGTVIGNTDRGYVLKRILRRAARFGRKLGQKEPFIHKLVPVVVDTMGHVYPEIKERPKFVAEVIRADEENFHRTMEGGLDLLEEELRSLKESGATTFPGDLAFKLWETYGFPKEDTLEMASDQGLAFDDAGYKKAAERHKAVSAGGAAESEETGKEVYKKLLERHGATTFVGYDMLEHSGRVLAVVKDGKELERAEPGSDELILVLDETAFYAESGGQVGDAGEIHTQDGRFAVDHTTKTAGGIHLHHGKVIQGRIEPNQVCRSEVDYGKRISTARHHSATHLMQGALKRVLGDHVTQSGSLVNEDMLRFDFTHLKAVSHEEIRRIEELVNEQVRHDTPVRTEILPAGEAANRPGVIAPFNEKYGDEIRVVSMGLPGDRDPDEFTHWDVEYCGGTHVSRTGEIGTFVVISESSISQGVRRIMALAGDRALDYVLQARDLTRRLGASLSTDWTSMPETVEKMAVERRELERQVKELRKQLAVASATGGGTAAAPGSEAKTLDSGVKLITRSYEGLAADEMRQIAVELKKKAGNREVAIVLGGSTDGKATLLVMVSDDLAGKWPAQRIVRELGPLVGGGGGGKPDLAQAGGKNPEGIPQALAKAAELFATPLT